jgi:hypothetical protein
MAILTYLQSTALEAMPTRIAALRMVAVADYASLTDIVGRRSPGPG